ncbi:MAG: hypothetical protein AUJ98_11140 [Bacteroidetes bacterium CG2_30_33_31]|nr:MAG: hypothetical protein AUJ98_11140 [Bacteroidetes bacterium CG2_30_33_31]
MPLIKKLYIGDHGVIGVWKIEETVEELLSQIHFSNGDSATFEKFKNKSRQVHWLSYRLAIRQLLGDPKEQEFYYDEYGKLHFKNHDYFLSVTHSGNYSAVIINYKHSVGIDIEKISDRINNISLKFLSVEELTKVDDKDFKQLTCMWSAKEALYKLYGKGELIFDKNIILSPCAKNSDKGSFIGKIIKNDFSHYYDFWYFMIEDYILVYCVDSEEAKEII